MLLFRHGGKTSLSPPLPGGLTAVVVAAALRRKEYHVVAAVEGHELETLETEQRPGLKRLLETRASRGYKRSRGREGASRDHPSYEGPGPSFYRCKERVQVYIGGVAIC
jgi:hypothetical protein